MFYITMCNEVLISLNFTNIGTSVIPSNCSDGDVRLNRYGRTDFPEGRVQVCVNRVWGSVCYSTSTSSFLQSRTSNTWDVGGTEVVCRQLGYQALGKSHIIGGASAATVRSSKSRFAIDICLVRANHTEHARKRSSPW